MLGLETDHRHRRLGRDPRHPADDETIEHHIADDEDRLAGEHARDQLRRGRRRARRVTDRHAWRDASAARANGGGRQRDHDQEQHQEFGVAEVVFEEPGRQERGRRRRARPRRRNAFSPRRKRAQRSRMTATTNHSQTASAGRPRSAAICSGTLCRCGLIVLDGVRPAILRVDAAAPCSGRRRRADAPGSCARLRAASPRGRGWSGPCRSNIDTNRCVIWPGASATKTRRDDREHGEQPEVLQREQDGRCDATRRPTRCA